MRALVADDDRVATTIVANALRSRGLEPTVVHDGLSAWTALTSGSAPQLVIVDWIMPGLDGVELCRRIRTTPALAATYVLLLTGKSSPADLVAGLDGGADDYMTKPIDAEELRARLQVGIRVATLQQRLADQVQELEAARDHLARIASTDALTDVYSRRGWFELGAAEFSRSRRYGRGVALMIVDLDHFKRVNDTFGHEAGDRLLQTFATLLRLECRQSDAIGRIGGEEFAILLPETTAADAERLAARIGDACRTLSVSTEAGTVGCSCSIGISDLRAADYSIDDVLRRADAALYDAKRSGRDCWRSDAATQPAFTTKN